MWEIQVQYLDHGSRVHAVTASVSRVATHRKATELAPLVLDKRDDIMSLEHTRARPTCRI
ncbi:MAG TPA: hypothetical protein VEL70_06460 [Candidatus Acidoferrum sp.]|nr:hypothetical protein [Candidatus Acidoferrum sp.]